MPCWSLHLQPSLPTGHHLIIPSSNIGSPKEKADFCLFCRIFGVWCLDLSVWCLDLSVGCLELSVGCLELSVGCLELSFECLELSFWYLDLSFGCLDLPFGSRPSSNSEKKINFQAVIKSAASAASPTAWELHGSARTAARQADGGRLGRSHATPEPLGRLR